MGAGVASGWPGDEPAGGAGITGGAIVIVAVAGPPALVPSEAAKVKLSLPLYPDCGV